MNQERPEQIVRTKPLSEKLLRPRPGFKFKIERGFDRENSCAYVDLYLEGEQKPILSTYTLKASEALLEYAKMTDLTSRSPVKDDGLRVALRIYRAEILKKIAPWYKQTFRLVEAREESEMLDPKAEHNFLLTNDRTDIEVFDPARVDAKNSRA